jgi:hypothetical protein
VFGGDDGGGEAVTVGGTTCGTTVTVIPALGWAMVIWVWPLSGAAAPSHSTRRR